MQRQVLGVLEVEARTEPDAKPKITKRPPATVPNTRGYRQRKPANKPSSK